MKFHDNKALKTAQWFSNMILRDDDINFINAAEYKNKVDTLLNIYSEDTLVLSGLSITHSTDMTVTMGAGTALSSTGSYFVGDNWGFVVDEGSFIVSVPEDQDVAFLDGGTLDRIDILEVRPVRTPYNPVTRKFKDPVTSLVSSAIVNTKVEYTYEFQVTQGSESASPVAEDTTVGWIKLAEVYIAGSATSITQADIIAVVDSYLWTTDSRGTVLPDPELGVSVSNAVATQKAVTIPKYITQAYTNLVQDPTDLTTANWNAQNGTTAIASDRTINGYPLTKILCDGTLDPQIEQQNMPVTASVKHTAHVIINRGNTTGASQLFLILTGVNNSMGISWDTKTLNVFTGDSVFGNWIDDDTVEIWFTTTDTSVGTLCEFRVDPPTSATNGEFIYVTACQLVDNTTTMFPFVDGSKEADTMDEAFTLPDKFTFDMIIEPKFAYDTPFNVQFVSFDPPLATSFKIIYGAGSDRFVIVWEDLGTIAYCTGDLFFDDGTSLIPINQRIRIVACCDLTTGNDSGLRFIVIPESTGLPSEKNIWASTPDIKSSDFPTMNIGYDGVDNQANSEYEYLRVYDGLLVGGVTESSDVDVILKNQNLLFDASIDEFKETKIDAGTPVSVALEGIVQDVKTGVAIQDEAILARHIDPEVHSPIVDALNALNTNQWDSGKKIVATDPEATDYFGASVSISGDYAIVGAEREATGGSGAGAAYIYHRTGANTWDSGIKIVATDPETNDYFGASVSISGDYAIVGANLEDAGGADAGAAYIYHRTGTNTWDSGIKIVATDPEALDYFGVSVSISGDYAIVGAEREAAGGSGAGAVYIYHRTGANTWDSGVKIVATDPQASDYFGASVAISGDYAIVGAYLEDAGGIDAGAAYIFNRTGTNTWDSGIKIVATDPETNDYFGKSVSISGDYAIVGADKEDAGGGDAGAAYIFNRTGTNTWDSGVKIVATDPQASDYFGVSVTISGDYAIVGASGEDTGGSKAGAAYIYRRIRANQWDSGIKIVATDPETNDYFGASVAISGAYAIVGADYEDAGGNNAGAVYVYSESFKSLVNLI